jgi:AcrR family transcriptional regulator
MTTAARPSPPAPPASPPAPPARPLRRDAQRNRDAIVAAARQVFCDHGLEAPLEEIARRAGVGIATLYRRFPSRVELLDAVLAQTVQAHVEVAEQALATDDPWDGFAYYLEETSRLQAADRGLNDVMGMRFPRATDVEAAKARLFDLVAQVVARAQQSGQLRADLTLEDLAFLNWANARILQAGRATGAPDAWRRHLGFLLDGFRADRAHPLPQPPLSPRQVHRAMLTLGRRSAGDAHEHPASVSSASAPAATAQRSPLGSHDPPGRSRQ